MTEQYSDKLIRKDKEIKAQYADLKFTSDYYNGQQLDTEVMGQLRFWIAGGTIDEFLTALEQLITKFRI